MQASLGLFLLLVSTVLHAEPDCRSCHSNPVAEGASPGPLLRRENHPVAVLYPPSAALARYRAKPELPLIGGRVECETCHEPEGPDHPRHGRLRLPSNRLCTACHEI